MKLIRRIRCALRVDPNCPTCWGHGGTWWGTQWVSCETCAGASK